MSEFDGLLTNEQPNEPTNEPITAPITAPPQPISSIDDGDLPDHTTDEERPDTDPLFSAVMGTAGTGKTFMVREQAKRYGDTILCATSGIAAINLGGTTLNSLLWYFDTPSLRTNYELGRLTAALRKVADSGYTRIAIDEMSMMDGEQLDILCMALDELNAARTAHHKRPLGLILIGDFCQLPPVGWGEKRKDPMNPTRDLPPIQFAFERACWERFAPNVTMLTEPRRQEDAQFIHALQAVRRGDAITAMNYFMDKLNPSEDPRYDGTTLFAKNDEVDRHNRMRLMDLPGETTSFTSERRGEQLSEWKNVTDILPFKREALCMILVNSHDGAGGMHYANGDLCYFLERVEAPVVFDEGEAPVIRPCARVRLKRNGLEYLIPPVRRKKKIVTGATGDKAARHEEKGSIIYLPLRLAWGTTTHKSQGLSLDTVQVVYGSHFFRYPSMLYVALSRARNMEGLRLVGTLPSLVQRCTTNPAVRQWL